VSGSVAQDVARIEEGVEVADLELLEALIQDLKLSVAEYEETFKGEEFTILAKKIKENNDICVQRRKR